MTTDQIKALVIQKANQFGINPNIALAQIQRESGFNPGAIGGSGERGLAQFMPGTWARFSSAPFDQAFDPETNLNAWGGYMTYLLNLFGGDYTYALTGYNGGEGHLTNPGKYGQPSAAAQEYGRTLAAAGGSADIGPIIVSPGGLPGGDLGGIPTWAWIAAGGLLLLLVVRD
jgi:soluble lytic murein transglycosylase-like protein